jgi:23S rRNA pseudouridine2605 synthase
MSTEHLVKILAERGVASRRGSERLVREGLVKVDGVVVDEPGLLVDLMSQRVLVEGKPLPALPDPIHRVLHKPRGCLTTRSDPDGRRTVFDVLEDPHPSLAAVGRLDWGTEGVLLLTNDGELAFRLTHPSYSVPKTYLVKVSGTPDPRKLGTLARGVKLEDGPTAPALVELVSSAGPSSWVLITISEGRNRIVRRMMEHIGHPVLKLKRVAFGGVTLRGLEPGQDRGLTAGELRHLRSLVRTKGRSRLSVPWEVRVAVAEALRLPAPPRPQNAGTRGRDEEGRPYRSKGWARPKPKRTRPGRAKKAAAMPTGSKPTVKKSGGKKG